MWWKTTSSQISLWQASQAHVVVSGCVTSHARWKRTTKKSSCRGDTSVQTLAKKPTQENRHTRTWTPKKTHLAASVDQMVILPWVRQHSLACGANNRIHSAVSPRRCLQSSLPSLRAYDSWPRGRGKLGVKVVGGLRGGREWCCHWRSQDDNMIAGFELSLPNPQQH